MKITAVVAILIGLLALALWSRTPSQPSAADPVLPSAEPKANPVAGPADVAVKADEVAREWTDIERRHALHPADAKWSAEATRRLDGYFSRVNAALLAKPGMERLQAKVRAIDCRLGSCTSALEFLTFDTSSAFLEMLEDGRFEKWLKLPLDSSCPLRTTAIPRLRGTVQKDFAILMHFECPSGRP